MSGSTILSGKESRARSFSVSAIWQISASFFLDSEDAGNGSFSRARCGLGDDGNGASDDAIIVFQKMGNI